MSQGKSNNRPLRIWCELMQPAWNNAAGETGKIKRHFPDHIVDMIKEQVRDFADVQGALAAIILLENWMTAEGLSIQEE